MVEGWRTARSIYALLVYGIAAFCTAAAFGQDGPAILLDEPTTVRPGQTATLTIRTLGAPDERVQLMATAEDPPAWLVPATWLAGPGTNPRLEIELSPPAEAVPGSYRLTAFATNDAGFTTAATAVWRVLPPLCAGAVEHDDGGVCRACPPNHLPNAAKTDCEPCPADTERPAAQPSCIACPAGQSSRAGAGCRCGAAARLTDDGCAACPPHADSVRNARNCDACPPGRHRPADAESCLACPTGGTGAACVASSPPAGKGDGAVAARTEKGPTLTISVSPTELTESATAQDVAVTATLSAPAGAETAFPLTFDCATCYADYSIASAPPMVLAEGATSASATAKILVVDDLPVDGGKVVEVGATTIGWYQVETASITLREPVGPTIAVAVADAGRLGPASACGGNAPCVPETAGPVRLSLEIRNPPAAAYRQCTVSLASSGPNTATLAAAGGFNDYQLTQAAGGARLGPGAWSADAWLVPDYDGEAEGPEALTLRGACAGSVGGLQHHHLRWAATTIWIGDVPWPTLTVERPANGYVAGEGIDCGSGERDDCAHAAQRNATTTLTATADPHHRFAGWGGACSGTEPCTVLLDADKTASAAFAATSHLLTVERAANGYVTGSGIDCGSGARADCEERHPLGATATLRAVADANHRLLRWSGACSGTAPTCSVKMDAARTAAAQFGAEQRWLWVSPPSGGRITGPGIDCGEDGAGDCVKTYDHGEEVVLAAVASASHALESWSGPCEGDSETCTATMDRNTTAGASFAPMERTLTVERPTNGYVSAKGIDCGSGERDDCTASGPHGSALALRATADEGYGFETWTGACAGGKGAGGPKCALRLDGDLSAGATFRQLRTLTLTAPANGYVTGPGIDCGAGGRADCAESYLDGATATLTPTAAIGHDFEKWGGACLGADAMCSLAMTADRAVTARFEAQRWTLGVTVTGSGSVAGTERLSCASGTCERDYAYGTTVTLTATAATGHDFEKWSGACSGTSETCTLTITANASATAKFKAETRTLRVTLKGTGSVSDQGTQKCSSGTCTWTYDYGTAVTLTAEGGTGYGFERWDGICEASSGESCPITLKESGETTVSFTELTYLIDITIVGKGTVEGEQKNGRNRYDPPCHWDEQFFSPCQWEVYSNESAFLTATAAERYVFARWSVGDRDQEDVCHGQNSPKCSVLRRTAVEQHYTTVTFVRANTLTVSVEGQGTVTATAGTDVFTCTSECEKTYSADTVVTLTTAQTDEQAESHEFTGWSGCTGTPCTVAMTEDQEVTATFTEKPTLEVEVVGEGTVTATAAGVDDLTCESDTCRQKYPAGTVVTLTKAQTDEQIESHEFTGWSGCAGTPCTVTMNGARKVTATFAEKPTLELEVVGEGTAIATAGTDVLTCTSKCQRRYSAGAVVTLTKAQTDEQAEGYEFTGWSGCAGTPCTVTMNGDRKVTATFAEKPTLEVEVVGEGTATATAGADVLTCTSKCERKYPAGTVVTLTKAQTDEQAEGYEFTGWSGCAGTPCTVTMNGDRKVTATFAEKPTLVVKVVGKGTATATAGTDVLACTSRCERKYPADTVVTFTEKEAGGYEFAGWTGCTGTPCTVTMTQERVVTATFTQLRHTLSVTIEGTGTVAGSAAGTASFTCLPTCTQDYDHDTSVKLTPTPGTGQVFDEWTGACEGQPTICTVTMDRPRSATAKFKPDTRTLSVTISGSGAVSGTGSFTCSSGTCKQDYDYGTEVTLAATVNLTHDLAWSGCDEVDGATCDVTMTSDKAVTATYTLRCPAGCTASTCGSTAVCRCPGESCPSNYARHGNCAATASKTCTGETDGCGQSIRGTRCTTNSRSALANRGPEICLYEHRDRSILGCSHKQRVCRATITHVGCVLSLGGPVTPPVDFQDEEVWTKPAHGYILPTFECGTEANTCVVEFEDETVVTDDYGVVDKDDTDEEWRWECHSDNGTVRQCALPKDDG